MTTESTPRDSRAMALQAMFRPTLETHARTLERELAASASENARLREALLVAAPCLDAWINGDGTNIDMNEWDAALMIVRAALVQS